jgi:hypothetical protein
MATYIVNTTTPVLSAVGTAPTDATPRLEPFARFQGGIPGLHVSKTDDPKGFVKSADVAMLPDSLPTLTTNEAKTGFCQTVTSVARTAKANRDYILALAYWQSRNLSDFGRPDDAKVGPLAMTVQDWHDNRGTLLPVDMFDPTSQAKVAAQRTAKAMADFAMDQGRPPLPVELFFFERLGKDGPKLMKLDAARPCSDAFTTNPPPAGSYAAEIAARTSGDVIKDVTDGLAKGFGASRADVSRLPMQDRFFTDEDWAPWLAVARMMKGDSLQTSTDKMVALFMSTLIDGGSPSATFVAFCMIFSGDAEVKANLPTGGSMRDPATWAGWAAKAPDPAPAGAVVLTTGAIAQGIGILAATATGDSRQVYLCSRDTAGVVKVELKTLSKDDITAYRWLDLSAAKASAAVATTRMPGASDALFVQKAPGIMQKLIEDFALEPVKAAAVLGNIGHECMGFRAMQEIKPTGNDGRGGLGWCQWTDTRRTKFETFAATHGGVLADEANYGYLKQELTNDFKRTIDKLVEASSLRDAVVAFERNFEIANLATVNYDERTRYAEVALGLHLKKVDPPIA